jgi:protein TonB
MRKGNSLVNIPLVVGIALSLTLHVLALYGNGLDRVPVPKLDRGRTVVHLTLLPSASAAASEAQKAELEIRQTETTAPMAPLPEPQPEDTSRQVNAAERDGSTLKEKGVTSEAEPFKAVDPSYPRISRQRGEEGTVVLSVEVLANGTAGNISVITSSGYRRLDNAALKAARQTVFTPARRLGNAVSAITELSYSFELSHE